MISERTIVLASLIKSTEVFNAHFPLFILPKDSLIDERDGIIFLDGECLDDTNVQHDRLGVRRLRSSYPNKFKLIKAVHDIPSMLKSSGKRFIDSKGDIFYYEKTTLVDLKYHKVNKVEGKGIACLVWLNKVSSPFSVLRPPPAYMRWAGVLYNGKHPWILYEFTESIKRDTKRKI